MKGFSLQKKMILQIMLVCTFLIGISGLSLYFQKEVATSYRQVSSNQFPKVESLSKLVANFRLIRIKVRTLGLMGNTDADQKKYIKETKSAIGSFLAEKKKFEAMSFDSNEKAYVDKMNMGWNSFFSFGKDLLSKYEKPTEQSIVEGGNMIRKVCPIEANKWMSVAQDFLQFQSKRTNTQVGASVEQEKTILLFSTLSLIVSFIIAMIAGGIFSRGISNKILAISKNLKESTGEVGYLSDSVSLGSTQLSKAATEAASSLQETVASIDEISSMVQRNADAASTSSKVSDKSSDAATRGKATVEAMIDSIKDISKSNDEIASEMKKNNEDISKIVQVISEIGEKTKVINDIVFQTKLLSFNASVEAARAGEHGKGFAVVAEEVGNLALMSGKAALEITEMLDSSTKQVTDIVETTKKNVESLVQSSKNKVENGTKRAHECEDVLDEILQNVTSVNEMVREIASASNEQSTGVREVTKAMQQLDHVTHQNTSVAQDSSRTAGKLKQQADDLNDVVRELMAVVTGTHELEPATKEEPLESEVDDSKVLHMPSASEAQKVQSHSGLKVAGLDTEIPDESDDRFEDL
ncbi:MAG: methyl-accepting chemotaxis protein [Bacteriovoracaceae bacterium]|jgi:methyl-accepting chemotaxis protein|nr:methyl-accepting chemotaxis protein [Bacteriovoracaceae bacterium]